VPKYTAFGGNAFTSSVRVGVIARQTTARHVARPHIESISQCSAFNQTFRFVSAEMFVKAYNHCYRSMHRPTRVLRWVGFAAKSAEID